MENKTNPSNNISEYITDITSKKIQLSKIMIDAINTFRNNFRQWFKEIPNNINDTLNELINEILDNRFIWCLSTLDYLNKQVSKYTVVNNLNTNELLSMHYLENQIKLIKALLNQILDI